MLPFYVQLLWSLTLAYVVRCSPHRLGDRATIVNDTSGLLHEYDYVIIGGGLSGLTVADRLTEDEHTTVLVIEYGYVDEQDGGTVVPGFPVPEKYSRNYQSVPQKGLNGRESPVYTGAVVGGGSVVNAMFFHRGSKADYDTWEDLGTLFPPVTTRITTDDAWQATTFTPPPEDLADQYPISNDLEPHGDSGPVGASFSNYQYPVIKNFFKGWNEAGVRSNPQPNAGFPNGAIYCTLSLNAKNQSRSSASSAHYRPIADKRSNYHIITGQSVKKVDFNEHSRKVTGAHFTSRNGRTKSKAKAKKEYILAAGAVHSPQIMQLSGIGPRKVLEGLGIKTRNDLPVGYNFHDQPSMFISLKYADTFDGPSPDTLQADEQFQAEQKEAYFRDRTGAYTIPYLGGSVVTFLGLPNITDQYQKLISDASAVDLSKLVSPNATPCVLDGYKKQVEIILRLYSDPETSVQETAFGGGGTVPIAMVKPLSRGSILINTTDATKPPVIDYQTFSHPTDLAVAVAALKKNREFFTAPSLQELGATETNPGAEVASDDDLAEKIRGFASSTWSHPVGTLPMMKKDLGGVVDHELKVYGIKNLRCVDASIIPIIPATHTSWPMYAIAEKAADLIKASANKHR